ncbi:MAG TPA: pectate lyase [Asticcacaulis sp.]|nr:pectate lyase [Asticcacaulis sp.]
MRFRPLLFSLMVATACVAAPSFAKVIGQSVAALAITADRVAQLPAKDQAAWTAYLKRSQAQRAADKAALKAELKPGVTPPPLPEESHASGNSMPMDKPADWYASPEARHVADVIVSFQTPAGGWGKNQNRTGALRQPGQPYVLNNISKYLSPDDFDTPVEPDWNYVGTLDNNATTTELRFLAKVIGQAPGKEGDAWRASAVKGLNYLLDSQFPNGGWPQVWPLEGGYHDAITYNDNAVAEAAEVLSAAAEGKGDYAFVPADLRKKAAVAAAKGVDCILATQVKVKGVLTVWGQQHDALTLEPVAARNFEPAELSSDESTDVLLYLMQQPHPSAGVKAAVRAGVAWIKASELHDVAWTKTDDGRKLVPSPGAKPIWARYYSRATGLPVFGERDKTIHDDVNELSLERRNGYSWFNSSPQKVLDKYDAWDKANP